MGIDEIGMDEVAERGFPNHFQDPWKKACSALRRGELQHAIGLLTRCVELAPRSLRTRRYLMAACILRAKDKKGWRVRPIITPIRCMIQYLAARSRIRQRKADAALVAAEKLLRLAPLNPRFLRVFVEGAEVSGLREAAVQTMETARDHCPGNTRILDLLGDTYMRIGLRREGCHCYREISELKPRDLLARKKYKNALASATVSTEGRTEASAGDESVVLGVMSGETQEAGHTAGEILRAVATDRETETLIADMKAKSLVEPRNTTHYLELARLYTQCEAYDEAIATLQRAMQMVTNDPELENALMQARVNQADQRIQRLRSAGKEDEARDAELEKTRLAREGLERRVKRYPNDLDLRYELGLVLFSDARINEAIEQFQITQGSPRNRLRSLYYLALCFKAKEQYDLATVLLRRACDQSTVMDGTKKDILYELGTLYDLTGQPDDADECFKQIYMEDIGFKDVGRRVDHAYSVSEPSTP